MDPTYYSGVLEIQEGRVENCSKQQNIERAVSRSNGTRIFILNSHFASLEKMCYGTCEPHVLQCRYVAVIALTFVVVKQKWKERFPQAL